MSSNPWQVLLDRQEAVWKAPPELRRQFGVNSIHKGPATNHPTFTQFEVIDADGQRMAHLLVNNPKLNRGRFLPFLDPKRTCSQEQWKRNECPRQPDLSEIGQVFARSHPKCEVTTASFAASYTCSTTKDGSPNPICVGPTLFYSNQMSLTFGVDGLGFLSGRKEGDYNVDLGGYLLFDEQGEFQIFSRQNVLVQGVPYDLTDTARRLAFEQRMQSLQLSGFQSLRLVEDVGETSGKRGRPIGTGVKEATRRALGHIGWKNGERNLEAAAVITIEREWNMPLGGQFAHALGFFEAITTNTGGWGPMIVRGAKNTIATVLPLGPHLSPDSSKGTGWYESDYYGMTLHACVLKEASKK